MARMTVSAIFDVVVAAVLLLCPSFVTSLQAQPVQIETILRAKECTVLLPLGDRIYGGLTDGGVMIWDRDDPASYRRWTSQDGLTDNSITDLTWTGSNLWVATREGGLTRVSLDGGEARFRKFTDIGALTTTSVAGLTREGNEILFYGTAEDGVGQINDGLPFAVYTNEEHGLIDNLVTDLAILQGDLWVATQNGVSRFAQNIFSDQIDGLPQMYVRTLCASGDTLLLAGTNGGVARWDDAAARWEKLGTLSEWVGSLAVTDGGIWALVEGDTAEDRLWYWDGADWTARQLPAPLVRAVAHDGDLWVAGELREPGMSNKTGRALLARSDQQDWQIWTADELLLLNVDGCDFGPDGALWLGSRTGQGVAKRSAGEWFHIYELATAENDSSGLFPFGANILTLQVSGDGSVWFAQRTQGIVHFVPRQASGGPTDLYEHITPENSGLSQDRVRRILVHPDGPVLFLTEDEGVDLLLDPSQWRNPGQWLRLPVGTPGLGGTSVWDGEIGSRDAIWFAVDQVGLVRWDPNGAADSGADLTWQSLQDDGWSTPVSSLIGTVYDPRGTRSIDVDNRGNVWAGGGGGVIQFSYSPTIDAAILLASFRQKNDNFAIGLLTGSVTDIALDGNGDLWVAMDAGLNRIRMRGDETFIDAYTDLVNYFNFGFGALYSPGIIAALPGGQSVWELAAERPGRRVLVGTDAGAALLTVGSTGGGGDDPLASLYLYPNPFQPLENGPKLKLGGIDAEVTVSGLLEQGGAAVEVYNLEGQQVFQDAHVAGNDGFWDGRNRLGELVSTGLYIVKVSLQGRTSVRSLAVVR